MIEKPLMSEREIASSVDFDNIVGQALRDFARDMRRAERAAAAATERLCARLERARARVGSTSSEDVSPATVE